MSILCSRWLWPAALLIAVPWATASPSTAREATTPRNDPLDASVAVPAVVYHSVFSGYRANADVRLLGWQAANDEVGRIGGWRAYAREVEAAAAAASAPVPAPAATPSEKPGRPGPPPGQGGHSGHVSH